MRFTEKYTTQVEASLKENENKAIIDDATYALCETIENLSEQIRRSFKK